MTNPDNVDGLPELPRPEVIDMHFPTGVKIYGYTRDQMRAYGELCRAAPAGGEYPTEADGLALELVSVTEECDFLRRRVAELSAPAGSGEVGELIDRLETEARLLVGCIGRSDQSSDVRALRDAAALLRKLQQGADYVMVPRQLSEAMHLAYWNSDNIHGDKVVITDITDGDRIILQRTWEHMISASQGQEADHARD